MNTLLEVLVHDGLGKFSRAKVGDKSLLFPSLARIEFLSTNISLPQLNSPSSIARYNKYDNPTIVFHPSIQLLDSQPVNYSSIKRQKNTTNHNLLPSDDFTFHVLPTDGLISLSPDLSDHFTFIESYLEETGINPVNCGMRVPFLPYDILTQLSAFFKKKKFILASLSSMVKFLTNPAKMSEYLALITSLFPSKLLLHAPAIEPSWFPLLAYAGIDIFDAIAIEDLTNQAMYITSISYFHLENISRNGNFPCTCPACNLLNDDRTETVDSLDLLLDHNIIQALNSLHMIRQAMRITSLRDLVSGSFSSIPPAAALLRKLDANHGHLLEEQLTVNKALPLSCSYASDLTRPEVKRFVQRVAKFTPFPLTKICLILPCSVRKPYSFSKSHLLFRTAIKKSLGNKLRNILSEVIVTSPLGIVPRELEGIYPAAHYDIPVTGDWNEEERKRAFNCLKKYLEIIRSHQEEVMIIAHVTGAEVDICQEASKDLDCIFTSKSGKVTSRESLDELKYELRNVVKQLNIRPIQNGTLHRKYHKLRSIADYQFGDNAGMSLVKNGDYISERRSGISLESSNKEKVAHLSRDNGYFSLSIEGAVRLAEGNHNLVFFDGEMYEGNAIYCPGISKADHNIRPGDDVMIMNESGELIGTGRSFHHGRFLEESDYGIGVSIRKKVNK
ncbi:MAG: DUF5591 domain-containing protein [Candidatus Hodarchaeales archaeon]